MKKVLVIDDEKSIIIYLTTILEDNGYYAFSAMSGAEGLDVAYKEQVDLICLDVMMPEHSGISLYEKIKRDPKLRNIPVMFISAYNWIRDLREPEAFRKMIPDTDIPHPELCMEKPIEIPAFLEAVSDLTGTSDSRGSEE